MTWYKEPRGSSGMIVGDQLKCLFTFFSKEDLECRRGPYAPKESDEKGLANEKFVLEFIGYNFKVQVYIPPAGCICDQQGVDLMVRHPETGEWIGIQIKSSPMGARYFLEKPIARNLITVWVNSNDPISKASLKKQLGRWLVEELGAELRASAKAA
jgi:hypothetical protein